MSYSKKRTLTAPSALLCYGLAFVSVAIAYGLARAFLYFNLPQPFTSFAMSAIAITFWYGGARPGIVAALLSIIIRNYFFQEDVNLLARVGYNLAFVIFALLMTGVRRRRSDLEVRVAERTSELTRANEELSIEIAERKHAEEKLRESQTYLAEAQKLTHTSSWAWEADGRRALYLSEEWYRIYGFDPAEGMPVWERRLRRIHPDDRLKWQEIVNLAIKKKSEYEVEFRLLFPDSTVKNLQTVGHPVLDSSGNLVQFVGSTTDITERKQAEALRDGESRILEMIARDAPLEKILVTLVRVMEAQFAGLLCSVLLLDDDGHHVRHGAAPSLPEAYTKAIDGLSIGPSAGSCGTAMYWKKPVIVTDILQDPLWDDYRDTAKRYGLRACWSTPILAHSGKVLGSFAMYYREPRSPNPAETLATDMASHLAGIAIEGKLTHEQLLRSEAYLAEAQKLTHTGSWVWEVAGMRALHLSDEWYRVYGFDPEEGMSAWNKRLQRIHPDDRARRQQVIDQAIREKSEYEIEYRVLIPGGVIRHVRSVGHPILDASGSLVQFVGSSTDITERRQAEEALRQTQADLTRISRITTMGELTASLAHEVNQPIAAAVTDANTCLRWLNRGEPDVEEAREAASRVVKDATRAAEIISRTRLLFKRAGPQWEPVDVNEVVREMLALIVGDLSQRSIAVRIDLAEDLPRIAGDRVQLQQVLMNLMVNGIDAMKEADGTRELAINSQRADNHYVLVTIADTGVGLPPQQADKIFNAFFTTKPNGTGMGLRISRSIIESHGGRLWADDNSPHGARFHLTLPIEAPE